jgi:hypothetical protein
VQETMPHPRTPITGQRGRTLPSRSRPEYVKNRSRVGHPPLGDLAGRWRRRPSRGQALVEFALVVIVMLLLLATVADFGRLFYTQITVENAARAGALVAARTPASYTGSCSLPPAPANKIGCAIVAESRGSGVTVDASEVNVACEDLAGNAVGCSPSPQPATRSRVSINKSFGFLMPLLSAILGNTVAVSASVAADQQVLPPAATFVPVPSSTPAPTPTPAPTASPTPTPTPTPTPSPVPCAAGFAPVPDLVVGATPGSTETVAEAGAEWLTAGFQSSRFSPSSGSTNKIVITQTNPSDVGFCKPVNAYTVTVTHT